MNVRVVFNSCAAVLENCSALDAEVLSDMVENDVEFKTEKDAMLKERSQIQELKELRYQHGELKNVFTKLQERKALKEEQLKEEILTSKAFAKERDALHAAAIKELAEQYEQEKKAVELRHAREKEELRLEISHLKALANEKDALQDAPTRLEIEKLKLEISNLKADGQEKDVLLSAASKKRDEQHQEDESEKEKLKEEISNLKALFLSFKAEGSQNWKMLEREKDLQHAAAIKEWKEEIANLKALGQEKDVRHAQSMNLKDEHIAKLEKERNRSLTNPFASPMKARSEAMSRDMTPTMTSRNTPTGTMTPCTPRRDYILELEKRVHDADQYSARLKDSFMKWQEASRESQKAADQRIQDLERDLEKLRGVEQLRGA